ncbi:paired domain-containing protein [Trichonephila clavipes]|nr:paired domain-containing protein [Trichonephila clavipes]
MKSGKIAYPGHFKVNVIDIILKIAPKTKEISLDIRKLITELHKEEKSFREIGKFLKLSFTTVGYIVKKYLEIGSVENKLRPGGPSKLTSRAKRMIVRSATNKPIPLAENTVNELLSSCNVSVSAQTVRNGLHSAGLKARTPRKKPYISEVTRKRRLEFAMKYKNKPMDFWKKAFNLGVWTVNSPQSHIVRVYDAGHGKSGVFHSAEWHDGDWSSDGIREAWLWFFIWVESF